MGSNRTRRAQASSTPKQLSLDSPLKKYHLILIYISSNTRTAYDGLLVLVASRGGRRVQQGRKACLVERRGRWGRPSEARRGGAACGGGHQDQAGGRERLGRRSKWGRPSGEGRREREARTARKVASSSILFPRQSATLLNRPMNRDRKDLSERKKQRARVTLQNNQRM
jgi:hypothetical protein